jgi:hypothetical protein
MPARSGDHGDPVFPRPGGGAYSSDRSYQNFTDPELEHPLQAYYGENLPRLIEVKRQYDPGNFFTFPQSIRG